MMPAAEITEETTASCRQASAGISTPQNNRAEATKPIADSTQKALATVTAIFAESEGSSQERSESQAPCVPAAR